MGRKGNYVTLETTLPAFSSNKPTVETTWPRRTMQWEWLWWPRAAFWGGAHFRCGNLRLSYSLCLVLTVLLVLAYTPVSRWFRSGRCAPREKVASTAHCPLVAVLRDHSLLPSLRRLRACHVVMYNRVPKCASRTVLGVFRQLGCQNGFRCVFERRARHEHLDTEESMSVFGRTLMDTSEPLLYSQHLHFINFSSLRLAQPVYINVVRDPLQRAVSHYYYSRQGSNSRPIQAPPPQFNMSLDECVRSGTGPCYGMNRMLPYFCGHQPVCRKKGEVALKRAKRAVREKYLVVGLTEDLPAFMDTLSLLLPHFFKNASAVYRQAAGDLWERYRTVDKPAVEKSTEAVLRDTLSLEYEFYQFVRQRFYHLYQRVRKVREESYLQGLWGDKEEETGAETTVSTGVT